MKFYLTVQRYESANAERSIFPRFDEKEAEEAQLYYKDIAEHFNAFRQTGGESERSYPRLNSYVLFFSANCLHQCCCDFIRIGVGAGATVFKIAIADIGHGAGNTHGSAAVSDSR